MKTLTMASITMSLLVGCSAEERLEISPIEIRQTPDGLTFSFDEKVHDFDVWKCTEHCNENTFSDEKCAYDSSRLVWTSSVAEDRDFSKTGARDAEAPIVGPIVYGKKPETAPHSSEPVPPLDDGYYVALATRYERACEDSKEPCWHMTYLACNTFKMAGGTFMASPNARTEQ